MTGDNGSSWKDITPEGAQAQKIASVFFLDANHAWVGLTNEGVLLSDFVMERTADAGRTWEVLPFGKLLRNGTIPLSGVVRAQWLDTKTGWLLFQASTSSNFSAGRLFKTMDGGITWTELSTPVGESVYFASETSGWAVGRDGEGLYRTMNGGVTWQLMEIGDQSAGQLIRAYRLPKFDTPNNGLIPVLTRDINSGRSELRLYSTHDRGNSWNEVHRVSLATDSVSLSLIPLDLLGSSRAVVVLPHTRRILRMVDKRTYETLTNQDGLAEKIAKIDMADTAVGWAAWSSKNCPSASKAGPAGSAGTTTCAIETRLISTADGGVHWSSIALPAGISGVTSQVTSGLLKPKIASGNAQALSGTQVFTGHGFDTCVPPGLSEMQDWWNSSPYGVWNVYIGGSNRGCKLANQAAITTSFVSQLRQQGWLLIPAWVGLQASCSSLDVYKMSSDPATAYRQGATEANAASETVADLGFSHTVVYFDLEYFSAADTTCLVAAQSFISGWTAQLHARGNQAGVYGSACGAGVDNYYSIANVPDAIWPAAWTKSGYDSSVSVWGIPCVPNTHWSNHQRIWQYAGEHDETWGSTSINVDSDVLDGIVGLPSVDCANPRPDGDHVGLYSEDNYCGAHTILGIGDYGDASALGIANDSVTSIKVGRNVEVILCTDANYLGTCQDFTGNNWSLANTSVGDNQVSSARVVKKLVLVSPPNGSSLLFLRPALDWADVPGASTYNLQVSRNSTFTELITNTTVSASAYVLPADLPSNSWLFWRVRPQVSGMWRSWSLTSKFKTPNPPSVPVLSSPANNALTKIYRPLLDWTNSTLPLGTTFDHYEVQVDDNPNFSSPVIDAASAVGDINASSYTPPSRLASNTTYYWHVRAYNTGGEYSTWSTRWSFRTALLPPVLTAPSNGIQLQNNRPAFSWSSVAGATGYHIQVSKDGRFTQLAWDATCLKTSCTPPTDLPAQALLYWRVSTNGTNGPSAWSIIWSFTTANPPSVPVLTSPANNALVRSYRPRFDWSNSSVPAGTSFHNYHIQIAEDPALTSMYLQADINGDATVSQFTPPAEYRLRPNKTYYWRVRAYNTALQYSSWSSTWKLRTVIAAPVLLAPANGTTVATLRPPFDWGDVSGATQYQIQISSTSDFSSIYVQASPVSSNYTPDMDLPIGALYWRVKALGPNGPSNWSAVWTFTTQ